MGSAQEMVRRGWITQDQYASVFPGEGPPDADGEEDWSLPLSDEEMLPVPELVEPAPVFLELAVPAPVVIGGNEARPRRWIGWAGKALLMFALFLGSFSAALPFFWVNSTPAVAPVALQESGEAKADLPPPPPIVLPLNKAKEFDELLKSFGQNAQPPAPAKEAKLIIPRPSLYERVRRVVRENKTEETDRLGIGDIAYQNVPEDGSIMVGMEVTYAPFFTHQIIKSVRPIYQRPNGTRYDGPVCGTPTQVGERVEARHGYAIGGAAIKAGMGIDALQLTFMEIGAERLNPDKSYLSKWLGGHGGAGARNFVNDGRPIIGIAGMRSKNDRSPAFCLGLVTTRAELITNAVRPLAPIAPHQPGE
jgi:hypothetical protein